MKRFQTLLWAVAVAAIGFTACSTDDTTVAPAAGMKTITVNAEKAASDVDVRTDYNPETNVVTWSAAGEVLRIFQSGAAAEVVETTGYTIGANENASFEFAVPETAGAVTYDALYPSSAYVGGNAASLSVNHPTLQTGFADLMIARPQSFEAQPDALEMIFDRLVGIVEMTIKGIPEGETITEVTFEVEGGKLAGNATVENGAIVPAADAVNKITTTNIVGNKAVFTAFPGEIAEGTKFTVKVFTTATTKFYKKEAVSRGFEIVANRAGALAVTVEGEEIEYTYAYLNQDCNYTYELAYTEGSGYTLTSGKYYTTGIWQEIEVRLSAASKTGSDIHVRLDYEVTNGLPSENVYFSDGSNLILDRIITIPNGQTSAKCWVFVETDWASWAPTEAMDYQVLVHMAPLSNSDWWGGYIAPGCYIYDFAWNTATLTIKKGEPDTLVKLGTSKTEKVHHFESGIEGATTFEMPIEVSVAAASDKPIIATLKRTDSGNLPEGMTYSFKNGGNVLIEAGQTTATETLVVTADWSKVTETAEVVYNFDVAIDRVTGDDSYMASEKMQTLTIIKRGLLTATSDWDIWGANSSWGVTYYGGDYYFNTVGDITDCGWGGNANLVDQNAGTGLPYLTPNLSVKIDFTGTVNLSKFGGYIGQGSISEFKLLISEDGANWEVMTPSASYQKTFSAGVFYFQWASPVKARYVIMHMKGDSSLWFNEIYWK